MFMLQWESIKRPDFISLEHLVKNEFYLDSQNYASGKSAQQLQVIFDKLCATMMSHEVAQ